jgi:DNA polymerase I
MGRRSLEEVVRTVIIDADVLVYQSALAAERAIDWGEELWTLHADMDETRRLLDEAVHDIAVGLSADRLVMALSDYTDPWRKRIMPSYKSNRKAVRRPVTFAPLREYVHERYETFQRQGLEGDDVLGILGTHPSLLPGEKVLVTVDKDLRTVPGKHVNLTVARKVGYEAALEEITEAEADRFHMLQTLAGDATDGYPGCPGIGMVRASALLDAGLVLIPTLHQFKSGPRKGQTESRWVPGHAGPAWDIVVSAYREAGLSESVALENARVARICRAADYDFRSKKVIPWSPPRG